MSVLDLLGFATGALRGHALRTGLSMLGVGVGVAAVILLTGLGEGARRYVTDQFMSLGTNVLIVVPGRTETTGSIPGIGGTPRDLTIADAETLPRQARGIHTLAPVSMGNETVSGAGLSKQVAVVGTTAEMQAIRNIVMRQGQFLPEAEWRRGTSVAVLGQALADDLFPGEDPVGEVVRIGDFRMRVIGVMAPKGVTLGLDLDNLAMVPVATGMRMFDRTSLFRIMIQHDSRADVEALSESVTEVLRERHDGEQDFTLITQDSVVSAFSAIFQALTAALVGIAAISLSVAGIGIMNVMLVAISERTSEIGLMKAVGAHNRQILAAFLAESVLLSAAGGLLGLVFALAAVEGLRAAYPVVDASPPTWAVGAALGVALAVGVLFGILPARRATRLDPIAALRS